MAAVSRADATYGFRGTQDLQLPECSGSKVRGLGARYRPSMWREALCPAPSRRKPSGIRGLLRAAHPPFFALAEGTRSSLAAALTLPRVLRNYSSRCDFGACAQRRRAYYGSRRALRRARVRADALSWSC